MHGCLPCAAFATRAHLFYFNFNLHTRGPRRRCGMPSRVRLYNYSAVVLGGLRERARRLCFPSWRDVAMHASRLAPGGVNDYSIVSASVRY